jgi:hypothetical protein
MIARATIAFRRRAHIVMCSSLLSLALAASVLVVVAPTPASASFCLVDGVFVEINPPPGAVTPRNARIRVRLTLASESSHPRERLVLRGPHWSQHLEDISVTVRAGGDRSEAPVAIERRVLGMQGERIIELSTAQPFEAGTRYEIVVSTRHRQPRWKPGGRTVRPSPGRYVSAFTTDASIDDSPPTWSGLTDAVVAGRRTTRFIRADGSSVDMIDDLRSAPWVVARARAATDRSTPVASLIYGIWVADGVGPIDYARPPLSHLRLHDGRILAGRDESHPERSLCDVAVFSAVDPNKPSPVRIGMRAIDWAGNVSAPSEVVLDAR